jgi:hypothetical protein
MNQERWREGPEVETAVSIDSVVILVVVPECREGNFPRQEGRQQSATSCDIAGVCRRSQSKAQSILARNEGQTRQRVIRLTQWLDMQSIKTLCESGAKVQGLLRRGLLRRQGVERARVVAGVSQWQRKLLTFPCEREF